jgi:hypothetical protein
MNRSTHDAPEALIRKVLLGDDTVRPVRDGDGHVTHYEFLSGGGAVDAGTFESLRANDLVREAERGFFGWFRSKAPERSARPNGHPTR